MSLLPFFVRSEKIHIHLFNRLNTTSEKVLELE